MRSRTTMTLAAAIALTMTGCATGDSAADEPAAAEAPPAADAAEAPDDAASPDSEDDGDTMDGTGETGATLTVGSTEHGDVLVDADGMTLYVFDPDEQGPSTCDGDCAASWPPLVVDGDPGAGAGVDAALVGTVDRDDGTVQVTYDGWPLYRWVADGTPGDATGQGVQDVWWVVSPDGTVLRDDMQPASGEAPAEDYY
jgi:predicted lipoprotein with Yx(FWY)xxD motif